MYYKATKIVSAAAIITMCTLSSLGETGFAGYPNQFYIRGAATFPVKRQIENYSSNFRVGGNAAIGVMLNQYVAAEIEGIYLKHQIKRQDVIFDNRSVSYTGGFLNILLSPKLNISNNVRPILGAGFGVAGKKLTQAVSASGRPQLNLQGATTESFSYQFLIGLELAINTRTSLVIDARYINFGKTLFPDASGDISTKMSVQMLTGGIKFKI